MPNSKKPEPLDAMADDVPDPVSEQLATELTEAISARLKWEYDQSFDGQVPDRFMELLNQLSDVQIPPVSQTVNGRDPTEDPIETRTTGQPIHPNGRSDHE